MDQLDKEEKHLLTVIGNLSRRGRGCCLKNRDLARMLEANEDVIRRRISRLKRLGLLKQVSFNGRERELLRVGEVLPLVTKYLTPSTLKGREGVRQDKLTTQNGNHHQGDEMGFFPDKEIKPTSISQKWAAKLRQGLLKKHITGSYSLKSWSKDFQKLNVLDKIPKEQITKVLDWYCQNIREEYIPKAYSAKSFRNKFHKIVDAMKRDVPAEFVTISDKAKFIAEIIQGMGWPKGSREMVPAVIQQSLDNFTPFMRKKIKFDDLKGNKSRLHGFSCWLDGKFMGPDSFVEHWMIRIHNKVWNWDGWDGDLWKFAFRMDHRMFKAMGIGWAQEYGWESKDWFTLLEEIDNVSS